MKRIPKLRFKEFSDEWEKDKLSNISELIKDGTHGTHKDVEDGIFLLSAKDIKNGKIKLENDSRKISIEDFKKIHKNYKIQNNDLVLTLVGTIGEVGLIDNYENNYTFQRSVGIIRVKKEILNYKYIFQYFQTKIFQNYLKNKANSSAQAGVYLGELSKLIIKFSTIQEQEKIANFLSSVDKKIFLTEEKLELFREYKKGVMQKIFSQELRFKDSNGNDYPEWEEKRLGEILKVQGGYAFKSEKFTDSGIPIIRISNISNTSNGIDINNLVYYEENSNLENFIINNGDFLIALSGATTGKTSIYNLKQKAYLNQRVGVFRKIQNFYYNFITQYGSSDFFLKQIDNIIVAGAQPNISPKDIENFIIKLPVLEEQQKISDFLSSIDSKIESIEKELEGLKEFKKGLLQQMFV